MENCVNYLPRKSFNTFGVVLLTLFGLFAVVVIGISGSLAFDTSFHCYDVTISKTNDVSLSQNVNIKCSLEYQKKFYFLMPMYSLFILNFGIVFALSIIYGYLVKNRVEKLDYPYGNATPSPVDEESQLFLTSLTSNPRDIRECLGHFSTFCIYVIHLFIARIIPLLALAVGVFYPAEIPTSFSCPWWPEISGKSTSTFNNTANSTMIMIGCTNPVGAKSETLIDTVATIDVIVVALTFLELSYIAWLAHNDRNFMTDQEFCTVYLLRKRKRIRKFVNKIRERCNPNDQLKDDFGGTEISLRRLEDVYVNVVIQEGRELVNAYPSQFDRHEIYQCHLQTPRSVSKLTSTADIFKPKKGEQNQMCPRTILVIGRPGIGKTMLTKKLLHQWKTKEDNFWDDKVIVLLPFRTFDNQTVTLQKMLRYSQGLSSDDFESLYYFILLNPTKTVVIFDGLDEVNVDSELLCIDTPTVIGPNEEVPVFLIYRMLISGTLLPGATILTTTRPTAQHLFKIVEFQRTVEILGFFEEQIKEYVFKFSENDSNTSEMIWNQIQGSAELLSLCYIPVNSYIVCLTLKESIENDDSGPHSDVPKTITELYKRAVKVLVYRHHPVYKLQPRPKDYFMAPFPKELKNVLESLKEVAKSGISEGKLIFEQTSGNKFDKLANCGLFHNLPDKRKNLFCFLHLTLQEFLAASEVIDDLENVNRFLKDNTEDPKWRLVIQFVFGLVGEKIKEAKMAGGSKTNDTQESKSGKVLADIQQRYTYFQ